MGTLTEGCTVHGDSASLGVVSRSQTVAKLSTPSSTQPACYQFRFIILAGRALWLSTQRWLREPTQACTTCQGDLMDFFCWGVRSPSNAPRLGGPALLCVRKHARQVEASQANSGKTLPHDVPRQCSEARATLTQRVTRSRPCRSNLRAYAEMTGYGIGGKGTHGERHDSTASNQETPASNCAEACGVASCRPRLSHSCPYLQAYSLPAIQLNIILAGWACS